MQVMEEFEKRVQGRAGRNIRRNCGKRILDCWRNSRIEIAGFLEQAAEFLEDWRVRIKLWWMIGWMGHKTLPDWARL